MTALEAAAGGDLLIVRHGPGRGRTLEVLALVDACIEAKRPALRRRIRVHATGSARPSLESVGFVLFLLSDPLREHYPACFAEAVAIAHEARSRGARILNAPENLSNSVKSRQADLWRKAGLPCATARPIRSSADLEPAMAALGLPIILRSDDQHVQEGVRVCKRVRQVDEAKRTISFPAVALQLIDVRARWREARPHSVFARFHHKKRVMVYGDTLRNNHVFFSSSPIVGRATSTFQADAGRCARGLRLMGIGRRRLQETVHADYEFFTSQPDCPEAMRAAMRALGIDMAAIDYSSLPDGNVILWEANPYVHLPPWRHAVLAEQRRIRERTDQHVEAIVSWFESLVVGAGRSSSPAG